MPVVYLLSVLAPNDEGEIATKSTEISASGLFTLFLAPYDEGEIATKSTEISASGLFTHFYLLSNKR